MTKNEKLNAVEEVEQLTLFNPEDIDKPEPVQARDARIDLSEHGGAPEKSIEFNRVYNEDCLEGAKRIAPGSVDLILTDPPYGTMNGFNGIDWDYTIDPEDVHSTANRLLRKNGKMVLFSQEPYTSQLITSAIPNVPFSYLAIWEKDTFANALLVNKAMAGYYEDILVFSKTHENENTHPLAKIVKKLQEESGYFWNGKIAEHYVEAGYSKSVNNAKAVLSHYLNWNYVQFSVVTKRHYDILGRFFDWGYTHEELVSIDRAFKESTPSVFNLWDGKKHKSNILKYKKDYTGHHPTQKPVALLEDLIKTYSNEGDTVVDLTIGSGSTAIACLNTNRNFIGFELDEGYYKTAIERINNHTK